MRNTATTPGAQKASLCSMLRGWGVGLGMRTEEVVGRACYMHSGQEPLSPADGTAMLPGQAGPGRADPASVVLSFKTNLCPFPGGSDG